MAWPPDFSWYVYEKYKKLDLTSHRLKDREMGYTRTLMYQTMVIPDYGYSRLWLLQTMALSMGPAFESICMQCFLLQHEYCYIIVFSPVV